jgi:uncharacterized membrane protein
MIWFLGFLTFVSIGLLVGVEFAVSAFINPVLWKLDAAARMHATRLFAALLGAIMPFWYAFCLLLLIAESVMRHHRPGFSLLAAAAGIWAAVIVVSITLLVPINNRMAQLNADSSAGQSFLEHKRWDALHRGRILALVAAFVLLLFAILK